MISNTRQLQIDILEIFAEAQAIASDPIGHGEGASVLTVRSVAQRDWKAEYQKRKRTAEATRAYWRDRYATDPKYRAWRIEQQRLIRQKKKAARSTRDLLMKTQVTKEAA